MRNCGQSLIEVLVAVGIILFALVGAVAVSTRAAKTSRVTADQTEASRYAGLVVEEIQKDKSRDPEQFFADRDCGSFGPFGGSGEYTAEVVCTFDSPEVDEVAVRVTVSWVEGDSDLSVSLNTIISKDSDY